MIRKSERIPELEKGSLITNIIHLSWPVLLLNVMQNVSSVFEMFLIGKIGVEAISAIAVTGMLLAVFWSANGGLMAGCVAVVSRLSGEKKYSELNSFLPTILITSFCNWALYAAVMFVFMGPLLDFFGARGMALEMAKPYLGVILLALAPVSILFMAFSIFRGIGMALMPLYLLGTAVILNIIFLPFLIFGHGFFPELGVTGSALAYLIGITGPAVAAVFLLFNGVKHVKIEPKNFRFDRALFARFIRISFPAIMQGWLSNAAMLILMRIASAYGPAMTAVVGIGARLDVLLMMMAWATGSSVSIMVGHNLGAGEVKRAEASVITGIKVMSFFSLAAFICYYSFAPALIAVFNSDPSVIRFGTEYLRIVPVMYLLLGVGIITAMALNGAGATRTAMVINMIAFFAIQTPLAVFLPKIGAIGEKGVFMAIAAAFAFQGIAGWVMYKAGWWKHKKI
ncbi:MAG TPA: MATE family efflux transporter [bacterium]|nr:MATE family efflux transporter [bacterium]